MAHTSRLNIFRLVSPVSILVGVLASLGVMAMVWPLPSDLTAPIAVSVTLGVTFILELIRRSLRRRRRWLR